MFENEAAALLDLVENKKDFLLALLRHGEASAKERAGLAALHQSITREQEPNLSPANLSRCLAATMQIAIKQNQRLESLLTIAQITVQSDDFSSDIYKMLAKLGHGDAGLKAMFHAKLNGK